MGGLMSQLPILRSGIIAYTAGCAHERPLVAVVQQPALTTTGPPLLRNTLAAAGDALQRDANVAGRPHVQGPHPTTGRLQKAFSEGPFSYHWVAPSLVGGLVVIDQSETRATRPRSLTRIRRLSCLFVCGVRFADHRVRCLRLRRTVQPVVWPGFDYGTCEI